MKPLFTTWTLKFMIILLIMVSTYQIFISVQVWVNVQTKVMFSRIYDEETVRALACTLNARKLNEKFTFNELSGYYSLMELVEPSSVENDSIYMFETSGNIIIGSREACAMESASHHHPDKHLYYFMTSYYVQISNILVTLLRNPKIHIVHLEYYRYFRNTPLENWFRTGKWRESHWRSSHVSDALRYVTLWRHGGLYLDTDVIVLKPTENLTNFVGRESNKWLAAGILKFSQGHTFIQDCIQEFLGDFRGDVWGYQGPELITRVLDRQCNVSCHGCGRMDVMGVIDKETTCAGVTVYPTSYFYSIHWSNWSDLFTSDKVLSEKTLKKLENSYLLHSWGMWSRNVKIFSASSQPYAVLAREHCPKIIRHIDKP